VIYVGANDITGLPNSKAGEVVAEELKELFEKIHAALPETKIYYISISPSVSKAKVWGDVDKCNKLAEAYCGEAEYLNFIDCTPALLNADGSYRTELFRIDTLHFNEKGYEVWTSVIAPILINDLYEK
jgi:lysophospholipase L1-like esterase